MVLAVDGTVTPSRVNILLLPRHILMNLLHVHVILICRDVRCFRLVLLSSMSYACMHRRHCSAGWASAYMVPLETQLVVQ